MNDTEVLVCEQVRKEFRDADRRLEVLSGVDLHVRSGETLAIVGASGSGKTTLLQILGGLDRPSGGRIRIAGQDMADLSEAQRGALRNRALGFVYQFHHLLPEFTALENVEMPFRIGRRPGDPSGPAREILMRLGLGDRLTHRPSALSGGEQQRVAIARAVVGGPAVVLADEPTGNLDPATGASVFELLRQLQHERGFAMVVATHSGRVAHGCDRMLRLTEGRLRPMAEGEALQYFGGGEAKEGGLR
jgi:lipoprotein-releasing system ATP-binding protein